MTSPTFGCQSMVEPLRRVLVRRPDEAFAVDDPERWNYASRPDLEVARAEHDAFVELLRAAGTEVLYHEARLPRHADSIFVHDPVIVADHGAVILAMGKPLRHGEERAMEQTLARLEVPVVARLHGGALAEGGDLLWLDRDTLLAGIGFRTNREGVRQLQQALPGVQVMGFDLPYFYGPRACLHLMSAISLVDRDLAVVYPKLLPVALWQLLEDRGVQVIEVPEEEFATMGPNVLALAPRSCVLLDGNPQTRRRLEEAGCKVLCYAGKELSLKAEGGATCLTRPILRG